MLKFYRRTDAAAASAIVKEGFKDRVGTYSTTHEWFGVWLSNVSLSAQEGAVGDTLIEVLSTRGRKSCLITNGSRKERSTASGLYRQLSSTHW